MQPEGLIFAEERCQIAVDYPWSDQSFRWAEILSSAHELQDIRMLQSLPNPEFSTEHLRRYN